jgi:hypothetical protein
MSQIGCVGVAIALAAALCLWPIVLGRIRAYMRRHVYIYMWVGQAPCSHALIMA